MTPGANIRARSWITEVLRPLRSHSLRQRAGYIADAGSEILDGIIIALYSSFCLEGDKKAPGDNFSDHRLAPADRRLRKSGLRRSNVPRPGHRMDMRPAGALLPAPVPEIFPSATGCWSPAANFSAARQQAGRTLAAAVRLLEVIRSHPCFNLRIHRMFRQRLWRGRLIACSLTPPIRDFHSLNTINHNNIRF